MAVTPISHPNVDFDTKVSETKKGEVVVVPYSRHRRVLTSGLCTTIGSLPHRDERTAARFAFEATPQLPAIPSLPKRSPAESMIAQAVVGIRGVSIGQYGSLLVDAASVSPIAPVTTDLENDAFAGMRAFLDEAKRNGATSMPLVKWQFTGPVTLGLALVRAGVPESTAFDVAVRTVRTHLRHIFEAVAEVLPDTQQVVFIDEPELGELMDESFAIAPDIAIDLMSGALAAVEHEAIAGLHCCADIEVAPLLAAGPSILSVPVRETLVDDAGQIAKFLHNGGTIAWGVVPTDGPITNTPERSWRKLTALWTELVRAGCDPMQLHRQALVTPACGLALHSESSATHIVEHVRDIGERIRSTDPTSRYTVGA